MDSGEKFCRKPPIQSSELSIPSTERSLFRPELPPVETAVMRALVGSEGSTGSVPGARYAMFAKLRAARGRVSRSCEEMIVWCTALEVSMGWVVMVGGPKSSRITVCCCRGCNFSLTLTSRTELTATLTSEVASANPLAFTTTWYVPGRRSSMRNSPRSSEVASRCREESEAWTTIFAEGMTAPLASATVPRNVPWGFWASDSWGTKSKAKNRKGKNVEFRRGDGFIGWRRVFMRGDRLLEGWDYYHRS